jgi:glutamate-1-semialdehyde 2,1-aminomutase
LPETKAAVIHTNFEKSRALRRRINAVIPGGAHTYAKGDDQYPEHYAPYIVRGEGCYVWDVDGNRYIEYGMGLRSVTLGHAFPPVLDAVRARLPLGTNFLRPDPIELEAAEELLSMIDGGEMVKFAKDGSDVTSGAVKLARAHTGRDYIAICAQHPFFSVDDWFIGTTAINAGIPQAVRDLTLKFNYNDLPSVEQLFESHPDQIAGVILEPERDTPPAPGFLAGLKAICHRHGAVFILDEMITGFRWHNGGAQKVHGIEPDLCTFGKALGNGFSIGALVGKRAIMELGGLDHARRRVFLISTTHGGETHSLAAARAVMDYYQRHDVIGRLYAQGARLEAGLRRVIAAHRLDAHVTVSGRPCCLMYGTRDSDGRPSQAFRTLFLQETIRRGVLAPQFIVSYMHSDEAIDCTIAAVDDALAIYAKALGNGIEGYLEGKPVKPVYREFN